MHWSRRWLRKSPAIGNECVWIISSMKLQKVPHHLLIDATYARTQVSQFFRPRKEDRRSNFPSFWIAAMEKVIPASQYGFLTTVTTSERVFDTHKSLQRRG